jgi:hypothetical protein
LYIILSMQGQCAPSYLWRVSTYWYRTTCHRAIAYVDTAKNIPYSIDENFDLSPYSYLQSNVVEILTTLYQDEYALYNAR